MRLFVGYGYNDRDQWIEDQVYPILRCIGFTVVDGKGMQGQQIQPEVERRIDQSDAAVGFFTRREGSPDTGFNSHLWVRDEMMFAKGKIPMIPIAETGVNLDQGLLDGVVYIPLDHNDRLACVSKLVSTLGDRKIRRIRLDPSSLELHASIWRWRNNRQFVIRYRTQNAEGLESQFRNGRLELVDQGSYLNVAEVPSRALIEVEGLLNGVVQFSSGWASADAVQIRVS
jgi:hypothetical protein